MKSLKFAFALYKMKNWSGGLLIMALAIILVMSYSFMGTQTQTQTQPQTQTQKRKYKQSANDFFRNHPSNDSDMKGSQGVKEVKKTEKLFEKPHIINVEGLGDLYSLKNMLGEEPRPLLAWGHMRLLLSRSDALPETAQGIKEAVIAWKDLLSTIEAEKASKFSRRKNCPPFVSNLNKSLSSGGLIIEVPCGLVEDSSITLVGIPDGRYGSFQIELIGAQLSGELNTPIILHYNVILPGDNMTEEPFIIQNTWTNELGWGKEERCPAHGSTNTLKVDELVLCNEQVLRRSAEENQNTSHPSPSNDMLANASHIGAHETSNFPFVDGNPFTTTLWVGLDGFHMTVNGRHETSFAYREVRNSNHGQLLELKLLVVWIYFLPLLKACLSLKTLIL